jgi:G3E family GTPase
MAELNVDAALVEEHERQRVTNQTSIVQTKAELVSLQNGCICCTLRADLVREVTRLVQGGKFDYIIIESTGLAEPMQVAESFCAEAHGMEDLADASATSSGSSDSELKESLRFLWNSCRLDTCVTVIDAQSFSTLASSLETYSQRFSSEANQSGSGPEEEGEKSVVQLLVEQVEFADVLILNKTELISDSEREALHRLLRAMNPSANIISTSYSKVDFKEVINTNLFDLKRAQDAPGWLQSLREGFEVKSEIEEYGIGSVVYRSRRPFHPQRLYDWVQKNGFCFTEDWTKDQRQRNAIKTLLPDNKETHSESIAAFPATKSSAFSSILRSKGFCWIAGRDSFLGEWGQAGKLLSISPSRPWFCRIPEDEWGVDESRKQLIMNDFMPLVGDRRQEIVFIGQGLNKALLFDELDACLLTPSEFLEHSQGAGFAAYGMKFNASCRLWPDPLPYWVVELSPEDSICVSSNESESHSHSRSEDSATSEEPGDESGAKINVSNWIRVVRVGPRTSAHFSIIPGTEFRLSQASILIHPSMFNSVADNDAVSSEGGELNGKIDSSLIDSLPTSFELWIEFSLEGDDSEEVIPVKTTMLIATLDVFSCRQSMINVDIPLNTEVETYVKFFVLPAATKNMLAAMAEQALSSSIGHAAPSETKRRRTSTDSSDDSEKTRIRNSFYMRYMEAIELQIVAKMRLSEELGEDEADEE